MKPKVLFTDGEGPIVFKDLAADIMEKTVPGLFPILSSWDDYLAEIGTEGYQPGDTLALVVPYFLAHDITDEDIAQEAKGAKVCLGVEEYIAGLQKDGWEVRIISTAYSQMWKLVGAHLNIPMEDIACTKLDLAGLRRRFGLKNFSSIIDDAEQKILSLTPLAQDLMNEINEGRSVVEVWGVDSRFANLRETLDGFYWKRLPEMGYRVLEEVSVMGGRRKIEVAKRFAQELGVSLSGVAYVGDSITDDALHAHLKKEGGLPIAINGNSYALRNAVVAVATEDMRQIRPVLDAWNLGDLEGVRRFVDLNGELSTVRGKEGLPIETESSAYYDLVNPRDQEGFQGIVKRHREIRKLVRGAATARLG